MAIYFKILGLDTSTCGRKVVFAAQATNITSTQVPDSRLPAFTVRTDSKASQIASLKKISIITRNSITNELT